MRKCFALLAAMFLWMPLYLGAQEYGTTVKQEMEKVRKTRQVNFVYDSSLPVDVAYKGKELKSQPLDEILELLFEHTGITYSRRGKYVILHKEKAETPKRKKRKAKYTLSGFVRDEDGETLINATVFDLMSKKSTTTNEYGFFSLTLDEGSCKLRSTCIGFETCVRELELTANKRIDFTLRVNDTKLHEVVVSGDLNSPILGTQTGKRSLGADDIKTEYSLFSSPDVVKSLQRISGVAEGAELSAGLYVHGGNADENLFLIDGTQLYQVNHSMGLFSSFNADVVKNVDFYKSGFPARYGGRLSSVVDVRTREGDMQHFHGSFRLGQLDGGVQVEGPIRKGQTSFNFGIRRSWLDFVVRPILAIANKKDKEGKFSLGYFFHDLNAKVTHRLNAQSKIDLSIYSGKDKFKSKDACNYTFDSGSAGSDVSVFRDIARNDYIWGNFNIALNWNYQFSPKLFANFTAVHTHNRSRFKYDYEELQSKNGEPVQVSLQDFRHLSSINDFGYRAELDFRPNPHHHLRLGHNYTYHKFKPQTRSERHVFGSNSSTFPFDTIHHVGSNKHTVHELSLYAEDDITVNEHWNLNAGVNLGFFGTGKKVFAHVDPRLAMKFQVNPRFSLKAGYTRMSQYVHKISNSFLELPTDYWVPTTDKLRPMHSNQLAIGAYLQASRRWFVSLEAYCKKSRHLLQYTNYGSVMPPAENWDNLVIDGKGRFYGLELDVSYKVKNIRLDGTYTLSWNKRKFKDFHPDWYYDKFDNRHRLTVNMRACLSKKVEMYAAWTYHTGNRLTFPTQVIPLPILPSAASAARAGQVKLNHATPGKQFIYEKPNNVTLPAYHRLDMGFNFRHTTKRGYERIWNVSLYNAYCHMNTLWVESKEAENGVIQIKTHGYIPLIPSFSYTIKF